MQILTTNFTIKSKGFNDILDITEMVQKEIKNSGLSEGNVLIFIPGSTAALTTIEFEPGLLKDYPEFMERIIPSNRNYEHDLTWHDGNGFSHVRASLQGASLQIPFKNSKLLLGTWQQIVLIDFDNKPRNRNIITQIFGN